MNDAKTKEQLLAEIEALKQRLGQRGSPACEGWIPPVILSRPAISVYVVFHDKVQTAYYDELDEDEKATVTLYGVKARQATGMRTVYEDELPIHNPTFQKKYYQEASALYHVYANNLASGSDYVGFFHYDMKFGKDAINIAKSIAMASPTATPIFFMDFFSWAFIGGQTAIVGDYPKVTSGLESYNNYFGTTYSPEVLVETKMIIANTFIVPTRLYEKLMGWMKAYFIDDISDDFYDRVHDLHFNASHIIEGLTGMFLALEVAQGAVYHRLPVVHKP